MEHPRAALPPNTDVNSLPLAGPPPARFTKPVTGIAIVDDAEDALMMERSVQEYKRLCAHNVRRVPTAVPQNVLLDQLNSELQGTPTVFMSAGSGAIQVNRATQAKRQKALRRLEQEELFQTSAKDAFSDGGYIIFSDRFVLSNQASPLATRHVSRATSMDSLSSASPSLRSLRSNQSRNQLNAFPSPPRSAASHCTSSSDAESDSESERGSLPSNAFITEEAAAAAAAAQAPAKLDEVNAFIAQAEAFHRPMFRRVDSSRLYGKATPYLSSPSAKAPTSRRETVRYFYRCACATQSRFASVHPSHPHRQYASVDRTQKGYHRFA